MIRVGIAGIGFMGWIHYLAYQQVQDVELAAICTRNPQKLAGDWTDIRGNFGPPGEQVDLSGIRAYSELDELLKDRSLDVIDICLPPNMHADVACAALRKKKHVFCEKPMALAAADCRRMVRTAERSGKLLAIGHVLPFFPEYAYARQVAEGGKYGKLLGGTFKRVISDPLWLADFYDPQRVGGPLIDLHVHDAHYIGLLFGQPEAVVSQGRMRGEVVEYCNSLFRFADPAISVCATSGVINQQGRSFTHGFELHWEKATMQFESAVVSGEPETLMPPTIFDDQGQVERPRLSDGDPVASFVKEIEELIHAIRTARPSPILSGELARDAIVLCQRQADSVKKGRPVKV